MTLETASSQRSGDDFVTQMRWFLALCRVTDPVNKMTDLGINLIITYLK